MKHILEEDHLIFSYPLVDRHKLVVNTQTVALEFVFPWRSRIPLSKIYSVYCQWEGTNDCLSVPVTYRSNVAVQLTFFKVRPAVRSFPYLIKPISIPFCYSPLIKPIYIYILLCYSPLMKPISISCCYFLLMKPISIPSLFSPDQVCMYLPLLVSPDRAYIYIQGVTGGTDQTSRGCSLC